LDFGLRTWVLARGFLVCVSLVQLLLFNDRGRSLLCVVSYFEPMQEGNTWFTRRLQGFSSEIESRRFTYLERNKIFLDLLAILHHLDARISVERLHGRRGKPSRVVIYFCKRETMFLLALRWSLHIFHRLSGPSILHHGAGSLMVRQSMNCFSNDASG
jgi:hypothetical protein